MEEASVDFAIAPSDVLTAPHGGDSANSDDTHTGFFRGLFFAVSLSSLIWGLGLVLVLVIN